jgi:hypothetical protein
MYQLDVEICHYFETAQVGRSAKTIAGATTAESRGTRGQCADSARVPTLVSVDRLHVAADLDSLSRLPVWRQACLRSLPISLRCRSRQDRASSASMASSVYLSASARWRGDPRVDRSADPRIARANLTHDAAESLQSERAIVASPHHPQVERQGL